MSTHADVGGQIEGIFLFCLNTQKQKTNHELFFIYQDNEKAWWDKKKRFFIWFEWNFNIYL